MILTINNRNYELVFGLGFLDQANKLYSIEYQGYSTGYGGMGKLVTGIKMGDPLVLNDLIKAGTAQSPQKPSNADIEKFIENSIINGEYDKLLTDFLNEIKKSHILKRAIPAQLLQLMEEEEGVVGVTPQAEVIQETQMNTITPSQTV